MVAATAGTAGLNDGLKTGEGKLLKQRSETTVENTLSSPGNKKTGTAQVVPVFLHKNTSIRPDPVEG